MIWEYFPIGMSFPVSDDTVETKKHCWSIALSALRAGGNWNGTELLECLQQGKPGSADREYLCILYQKEVTQNRANCAVWKDLSRLHCELSLHYPLYQTNAIDSFLEYNVLAEIDAEGVLHRSEKGKTFLPEKLPDPMPASAKKNMLLIMDAYQTSLGYSAALRAAGRAFAEQDWTVRYCPASDGGIGTAYALTYALRGRFEWLPVRCVDSGRKQVLLGILPGSVAAFDAAALQVEKTFSSECLGAAIRSVLDYGYRRMILPLADWKDDDKGEGMKRALFVSESEQAIDPRLQKCEITVLTKHKEAEDDAVAILQSFGARVMDGPDYMADKLNLFDRCRHTGRVIACGNADAILKHAESICAGHTPYLRLPASNLADLDALYTTLKA